MQALKKGVVINMANWVTHLIIADKVMANCPQLDRRGFCVGNIAPDCNIENEDWTSFTPPRELTHWMSGDVKIMSDSDNFCREYIIKRKINIQSDEEYSFLLGYYAHLITDAAWKRYVRDEHRVKAAWLRLKNNKDLYLRAKGYPKDWATLKMLVSIKMYTNEIYTMEAEYLRENPDSGYLKEILPLKEFPDYIDYLPTGCIVRKIGVMGYIPKIDEGLTNPIAMSREEFRAFTENTASLVMSKFREVNLI